MQQIRDVSIGCLVSIYSYPFSLSIAFWNLGTPPHFLMRPGDLTSNGQGKRTAKGTLFLKLHNHPLARHSRAGPVIAHALFYARPDFPPRFRGGGVAGPIFGFAYLFGLKSQGGIGLQSAHNPLLAALASSSNCSKVESLEYLRNHQAIPAWTSS
jgi:hypothetical protein